MRAKSIPYKPKLNLLTCQTHGSGWLLMKHLRVFAPFYCGCGCFPSNLDLVEDITVTIVWFHLYGSMMDKLDERVMMLRNV